MFFLNLCLSLGSTLSSHLFCTSCSPPPTLPTSRTHPLFLTSPPIRPLLQVHLHSSFFTWRGSGFPRNKWVRRCEELRRDEGAGKGRLEKRVERSVEGCEGGRNHWRRRTMEVERRLEFSSAACQTNEMSVWLARGDPRGNSRVHRRRQRQSTGKYGVNQQKENYFTAS